MHRQQDDALVSNFAPVVGQSLPENFVSLFASSLVSVYKIIL
jgi:hypothetical protein